jgi:hypothetical protein
MNHLQSQDPAALIAEPGAVRGVRFRGAASSAPACRAFAIPWAVVGDGAEAARARGVVRNGRGGWQANGRLCVTVVTLLTLR